MSFGQRRSAITWWTAAIDISDKDVFALITDALNDLRQQLSGASYERKALRVLVCTRRLTDEHQVRLKIARRVHNLRPPRVKLTASAIADVFSDVLDRLAGLRQIGADIKKRIR